MSKRKHPKVSVLKDETAEFLAECPPTALEQFTASHAPYIAAADANHAWRRARMVAMEELRGLAPALGLSAIDMAECMEGAAQELRQRAQQIKLAGDKRAK